MPSTLSRRLSLATLSMLTLMTLASRAAPPPVTLESSAAALQVAGTPSLRIGGTGRWFQFGQAPAPGQPWPAFELSRYSADIDYERQAARVQITRRQVVVPGRERPAQVDQSADQYVLGSQAWNRPVAPATAPATAQPAAVAERSAEIWATPQGFVRAALAHQAHTRATEQGTEVSFRIEGQGRYVGWLDAGGRVERVQTWIATPVLGDTLVETRYSGYKDFAGVPFPTRIQRSQGGHPVLDLQVTEVQRQAAADWAVPPEVAAAALVPAAVTATLLAEGVYHLTGGSHHSVLIEQRDHLVLVEAPLNEERSLALIAKARELVPGKPIKYLVNTHAHFDHSGGLRTFVDHGAVIVTQQDNRAFYEQAWAAPRTLGPDRLAASGKTARFEVFRGKHVLSDGRRRIEIHEIAGNGHNDAFALVYLPAGKILVEADAYTPPAANQPAPASPNPYTVNLVRNIERLQLDVQHVAALHGPRVVTLAELRSAAAGPATAQR